MQPNNQNQPSSDSFLLNIENRDGVVYSGEVSYVSSRNETGKFDILPLHANFITLIKGDVEVHPVHGSPKNIPADNAVLKFEVDRCDIYMGVKK